LRSRLVYPLPSRIDDVGWFFTGFDTVGEYIRSGCFEEAERLFVRRVLSPGMVVLDIGAHIGIYSVLAARCVGPSGHVVAFEPAFRERRLLRVNLAVGRFSWVRVEPVAVGASEGSVTLHLVLGREGGCNSLRAPVGVGPTRKVAVWQTSLDRYVERYALDRIDLIKIDVEGGELEVLRGSQALLTRHPRPIVLCEVSDRRTAYWGHSARGVVDLFGDLGYDLFDILPLGRVSPAQLHSSYDQNVAAIPRERVNEFHA
jgi:FkbM family methyltransferase